MRVGYKKTEIGEIPEEWEVKRLEDFIDLFHNGIWGEKPKNDNYEIVIRSTEIKSNGEITLENVAKRYIEDNKKERYKIAKGDILIVSSSGSKNLIGRTAYCNEKVENCLFSNFLLRLRLKKQLNSLFFYYFTKTENYSNFLRMLEQTSSGLRNLPKNQYIEMNIPVPTLPEQQKIAEILSTVDEGIEVCDKKIEKLERYKKGMMQKLLTKGIGHTKFKNTEIGEIPEGWEVVKVKNLFEKAKNKRIIGIKTKEYLKEGKFPIIDQSNKFISGYTNDENRVYKGDLPIIIFGDHTKIFKFLDFPFALGADGTKILILKKNYNIKYIYYILNFIKFQNEGYRRHIDILREKVIAISSNSIEQQKIAEVLSTIDELIELEKQRKKKFERYKKGLMNDLLTGRKRVKIN
jgi:type I restriction enzyme S subunit